MGNPPMTPAGMSASSCFVPNAIWAAVHATTFALACKSLSRMRVALPAVLTLSKAVAPIADTPLESLEFDRD